jgi:hypothetical protein
MTLSGKSKRLEMRFDFLAVAVVGIGLSFS